MYLAWFDADRKKPTLQKIAEAHQRYVAKFGRQPLVCLVNPEDAVDGAVVEVRPLKHIGRNCFWIGSDDAEVPSAPETPAPAARPTRRSRQVVAAPEAAPASATPVTLRNPRKVAPGAQPLTVSTAPGAASTKRRPRRERSAA